MADSADLKTQVEPEAATGEAKMVKWLLNQLTCTETPSTLIQKFGTLQLVVHFLKTQKNPFWILRFEFWKSVSLSFFPLILSPDFKDLFKDLRDLLKEMRKSLIQQMLAVDQALGVLPKMYECLRNLSHTAEEDRMDMLSHFDFDESKSLASLSFPVSACLEQILMVVGGYDDLSTTLIAAGWLFAKVEGAKDLKPLRQILFDKVVDTVAHCKRFAIEKDKAERNKLDEIFQMAHTVEMHCTSPPLFTDLEHLELMEFFNCVDTDPKWAQKWCSILWNLKPLDVQILASWLRVQSVSRDWPISLKNRLHQTGKFQITYDEYLALLQCDIVESKSSRRPLIYGPMLSCDCKMPKWIYFQHESISFTELCSLLFFLTNDKKEEKQWDQLKFTDIGFMRCQRFLPQLYCETRFRAILEDSKYNDHYRLAVIQSFCSTFEALPSNYSAIEIFSCFSPYMHMFVFFALLLKYHSRRNKPKLWFCAWRGNLPDSTITDLCCFILPKISPETRKLFSVLVIHILKCVQRAALASSASSASSSLRSASSASSSLRSVSSASSSSSPSASSASSSTSASASSSSSSASFSTSASASSSPSSASSSTSASASSAFSSSSPSASSTSLFSLSASSSSAFSSSSPSASSTSLSSLLASSSLAFSSVSASTSSSALASASSSTSDSVSSSVSTPLWVLHLQNYLQTQKIYVDFHHCPICLDEERPTASIFEPCGHTICSLCAEDWTRSKCPICRSDTVLFTLDLPVIVLKNAVE